MTPLEILHKKGATKAELRGALAASLGVPVPDFSGGGTSSLHNRCKQAFQEAYQKQTGVPYAWSAKDAGAMGQLLAKLKKMSGGKSEEEVAAVFQYILENLPSWYKKHSFEVATINGKLNAIVGELKGLNNGELNNDYRARIAREAAGQ